MTIYTKKGEQILYEKESYVLRGLFMKIYNEIGPGIKESVYVKALIQEFKENNILFENEKNIKIIRKGEVIGKFRVDFLVYNKIIIEIKALEFLPAVSQRQLQTYLSGSVYRLGFLVNFGGNKLEIIRKINDKAKRLALL
ncbi:MAG: hypothetical protein UR69_C0004G0072 [Candidatus Moranbacteria bacterium GW2011_GWE2_35_2-]|nr:MAG: hypothetical protein UR69_C0004G0072 [Candidatus Moranbacteria bacterium GW2011_GWE2_35_2-]KKQ22246.1 MAG: hypothetical protein US37_C0003G0072 [Candidatus Moranbacteria bacterium GW2011_GWF2_37_11]KKQ28597.1 MAG: hypothetical protein US44_C0009G0024 [Candidatus Moranbacteria bacterium GW2011_GWD1_37_17]KKQ30262.1 MAG: hypothetical protein US47_C0003G0057 [Candidatus Moranbacteria bacterium GW2011_GWE1_37_24]KKQ47494.1 MAG: hypothetical protein US66_C0011G0010 [Candidatus Moranbacteria 